MSPTVGAPSIVVSSESESPWEAFTREERQAGAVRHLLARRFTRLGRYEEARPYFPPILRRRLDALRAALNTGRDSQQPAEARAKALFEAATMTRWYGFQLLGTELDPDVYIYDGSYPMTWANPPRVEGLSQTRVVRTTDEERARVASHGTTPNLRFHYRYIAADLAWEAAQLMPDETEKTARVLCEAGTWLKDRDPKAADRFYKAMVRRCGSTALGKEADRVRWFPR